MDFGCDPVSIVATRGLKPQTWMVHFWDYREYNGTPARHWPGAIGGYIQCSRGLPDSLVGPYVIFLYVSTGLDEHLYQYGMYEVYNNIFLCRGLGGPQKTNVLHFY